MDLKTYFEKTKGSGIVATADKEGPGYKGKRLFLTKVREEQDSALLKSLRRRQHINTEDKSKFLAFFRVDKELSLVGAGT